VRSYVGRRVQPKDDPVAELFELEPEDVHMYKILRALLEPQQA